jgi:hypothetical protein
MILKIFILIGFDGFVEFIGPGWTWFALGQAMERFLGLGISGILTFFAG